MTNTFRKAYTVIGVVLLLEFFAQFYFIAGAIFTIAAKADENAQVVKNAVKDAETFAGLHAINGTLVVPVTMLVLIALSFGSRYPWRTTGLTALLFLLLVIQYALAIVGFLGVPVVAALHGINALVLTGLGMYLVSRNWAFGRRRAEAPVAYAPTASEPATSTPSSAGSNLT